MDRYQLFRMLMDIVADHYDVTDAKMKNYAGEIEISGAAGGKAITICVDMMEAKEAEENA